MLMHSSFSMLSHAFCRTALLLAAAALPLAGPVSAQVGRAAVVFLMIEPDSRAAGMGNAGVALSDNANAIFWNPAGLADQRGMEFGITHSNWLPEFNAGLYYEFFVAKRHFPGWGTFGAHITYLFLGEHEQRDEQNEILGKFRSYDLAAGLSWAFKPSSNLSIGTGARLIYSSLGSVTVGAQKTNPGISVGMDVGVLYKVPQFWLGLTQVNYNIGANLANMGPKIQYSDGEQADPIPTYLRFGHALTFRIDDYNKISLANDFSKILVHQRVTETCIDPTDPETCTLEYNTDPFYKAIFSAWRPIQVRNQMETDEEAEHQSLSILDQLMIGTGFEYWYDNLFAARAGYFYENPYNGDREFLTFGAGIRWNILGVDFSYVYALEENHPLANTMRFSLLIDLAR